MSEAFGDRTIVIKDGNLFFLTNAEGNVPLTGPHGLGLYYNDCRFLNGYELKVDGENFAGCESDADRGDAATLNFSIPEPRIEIRLTRAISGETLTLHDVLTARNLTNEAVQFSFSLIFQSHFEDIFAIRGMKQRNRGTLYSPDWTNEELSLRYAGADGVDRVLTIHFSPPPDRTEEAAAHYDFKLGANAYQEISVSLRVLEGHAPSCPSISGTRRRTSLQDRTQVSTDNPLLNQILDRSLRDLAMLRSNLGNAEYFAAGIPWYVALFGRDSIITALQMLAYDPEIAEQTIRLLAHHQGREINEWRDEEPGKILHELRVGEMANLNEIPHTPYYGTIDATPLWLVLIGRHAAWTGDLKVFSELRQHIDAALNWIDQYGDFDRDGYVEYQCKSERGLVNQGWKDSGDGIVNADGSLGKAPIALVEVQGYVYAAKIEMAQLYRRAGDERRATTLESEAHQLRERFNRDFWLADGYYALALQGDKSPCAILSSNAGHALWSGIAEGDLARQTAEHLLSPEMFSGWGIRTLSAAASRYDPLSYHLGTVWPHDNSLIGAGLKRYGLDDATARVLNGMLDATVHFESNRLPELFGGFSRADYPAPVAYPIACRPQAWAAGTVPYLLTTVLGLEPEAFEGRLQITHPLLPENVNRLEMSRLRVGAARVDLLFVREGGQILARTHIA